MHSLVALLLSLSIAGAASATPGGPATLVNPFVGTQGDHGQLTPAATAPFGMVQLSPDTRPAQHAGYDFAANELIGFSHTRAVGVGCGGGGGDLLLSVGYQGDGDRWAMDKSSEAAAPGWYHIRYGRDGIEADLAASGAAGISRFRMPRAGLAVITLDPRHAYTKRISAEWDSRAAADLRGRLAAGTVCDKGIYRIAFAARLSLNGADMTASPSVGGDGKLHFSVPVGRGDIIELRTGLSAVDPASAARTRDTELGSMPFEEIRSRTFAAWNQELGRIRITGAPERSALFYTHLFRVMQAPVRIDDPAGRFRGSDGKLAAVAAGRHRYSGWAIWDNYRTQLPLIALIDPDRAKDIAASLAGLYLAGKAQWATETEPFITVRTEHAGVALLDYWRKGIGGFDAGAVLPLMAAETATLPRETPDQQIETAYDEWAVSELARELGQDGLAHRYRRQALSYRTMWQATFRDIGPDFDVVKARGLYQGTLWQYRWAPVFDLEWLVKDGLGRDRFNRELAQFFGRKLFNMTNQPDIHAPFLFTATGEAWRTQAIVDDILNRPMEHWYANEGKRAAPWTGHSFALDPIGYADGMDDDAGGMAAWYVWASLGLYPLVPGEPFYVITMPGFARSTVDVGGGRSFTIERRGPASARYIDHVELNGRRLPELRIDHSTITRGGHLLVVATDQPNSSERSR